MYSAFLFAMVVMGGMGRVAPLCDTGEPPPFPPSRNVTIRVPGGQGSLDFACLARGYPEGEVLFAGKVICMNREAFPAVIFTGECEGTYRKRNFLKSPLHDVITKCISADPKVPPPQGGSSKAVFDKSVDFIYL